MVLTVNGDRRDVSATRVPELLVELGYEGTFFAVAVNRALVRRQNWSETALADGDEVEIVTPRQGG